MKNFMKETCFKVFLDRTQAYDIPKPNIKTNINNIIMNMPNATKKQNIYVTPLQTSILSMKCKENPFQK